jgi:hypothetical protein
MLDLEQLRQKYRYFAFIVVRDAIGFYLGIPKFLEEENLRLVKDKALAEKLNKAKRSKNRELSPCEIEKCIKVVNKSVEFRIKELKEDFEYCESILFEDNLWLAHLNLNPEFLKTYLDRLDLDTKSELAVVPKWGINDHSLGRSYINDNFSSRYEKPNIFDPGI